MRAYEFRRYLLRKSFGEADIKHHIENVRRIEKVMNKTAESLPSIESVDSQIKWRVLPWKKDELLESVKLYFNFTKSYAKPVFYKIEADFKDCPECGAKTPLGSTYCRECGRQIGKTPFKQVNEMYDSVEDKWKKHRGLMIGSMAAIATLIIYAIIYTLTAFPIPNVVGQDPMEASRMLIEHGTKEQSIHIESSYSELSKEDVINGEYEVIGQHPNPGTKVHKSTEVTLSCEDIYKKRSKAISDCRYSEATEAEAVAKEYNYTYEEKVLDQNLPEDEQLYVFRVTDQNDKDRSVIYELNSKKNIEEWMIGETTELIGKPAKEGKDLDDHLGCRVCLVNYDEEEVASYSDGFDDYLITGVKGFDFEYKKLSIAVDTKQHLEELDLIASLKDKIPYKGMSESYIDDTGAGKHTTEEGVEGDNGTKTKYIWKSDDGKYEVLTAVCEDGIVTNVTKEREEVFWKEDLPDYSVDADEIYAELKTIEKQKKAEAKAKAEKEEAEAKKREEQLEAEAEAYAADARDEMIVFVTNSTGTYHIDGCRYIRGANTYESTYGKVKNSHHACDGCNPDGYCERSYEGFKSEYIRRNGDM